MLHDTYPCIGIKHAITQSKGTLEQKFFIIAYSSGNTSLMFPIITYMMLGMLHSQLHHLSMKITLFTLLSRYFNYKICHHLNGISAWDVSSTSSLM